MYPHKSDEVFYTPQQVADLLCVARPTIDGMNIPQIRLSPQVIRIRKSDLDAYIESKTENKANV